MVHGGTAFLDQTIELMKRHPNLLPDAGTTFSYVLTRPRVFDKVLGKLVAEVGSDRLLFASGNNLAHPQPLIEAFRNYQFAPEHCEEFDLPRTDGRRTGAISWAITRSMLYGIDREALLAALPTTFSPANGPIAVPRPWSGIRG